MTAFRNTRTSLWILPILFAIAGIPRITTAASLTIGNAQASVGQTEVQIAVNLDVADSEEVAAFQLDLQFDDRLKLVNIHNGSAATAADKSITWDFRSNGSARVLLYGLNRNVISSGHVLKLIFDAKSDAVSGQSDISAKNLTAASPEGGSVSLSARSGYVVVEGGAAPEPTGGGGGSGGG